MKTLLKAKHPGRHINGQHGCFARWANCGLCPGVKWAEWLNSLGDDKEPFSEEVPITNLQVRENWLYHTDHLEPIY